MKKFNLLMKTLLMAAGLFVGTSVWAANNLTTWTGVVGNTDRSTAWWTNASKSLTIAEGETYVLTFVNYNDPEDNTYAHLNWYFEMNAGGQIRTLEFDGKSAWGGDDAFGTTTWTKGWDDFFDTKLKWNAANNGAVITLTVTRVSNVITGTYVVQCSEDSEKESYTGSFSTTYKGDSSNGVNFYILAAGGACQVITNVVYTEADGTTTHTHSAAIESLPFNMTWAFQAFTIFPFNAGNVYDGTNVDAFMVPNTTATAYFDSDPATDGNQAYTLGTGEIVTTSFTAYHGSIPSGTGTSTVQLLNSAGVVLISYTYDILTGNVTDVKFGGTTVAGFEAFKGRSSTGNHDVNGLDANSYQMVATEGCNPVVTMSVAQNGNVTFKFVMSAGSNAISKSYSTNLSGTTMDLASIKIIDDCTTAGRSIAINNLSIRYPIVDAIDDCKVNEPSSDFATAIDAQSFASVEEVYAFHTQWQIAQADAASSNDITKVIFDAAVSSNTRWNDARTLTGEQYTGALDNTYFDAFNTDASDASQTIYGLPAGTYTIKVATRSSAGITDKNKYNVWVSGGSANVSLLGSHIGNAGGNLGNGWNWTILSFTLDAKADVTIGFYARPQDNLWAGCDDWHLYKGTLETSVSANVGESGYATFVSPYSLDFTGTSIKPYTVTVAEKGVATLTEKTQVPSNTPVLLYYAGGSKTEDIPVIGSANPIGDNDLIAGAGNTVATIDGTYTNMILNNVNDQIGFYFAAGKTVATNRAYLHIPTDMLPADNAPMLLVFDNADITGISEVAKTKNAGNETYYNLNGQRMAKPTKGLNIVNGKKVIIK